MKITVKESTMVKPMEERASGSIWLASIDLLQPDRPYHSRYIMFYRPSGSAKFFDAAVLKAALSRALVEFYPYAGRLRKDDNGRLEIHCNGEGASFAEAECDGTLDELGGFTPRPDSDITLLPTVDYSNGISSFPVALYQLTRFKCGGISLGLTMEHHLADGNSSFQFIRAWCDIARGGATTTAAVPPFMDRRLLAARNPPQPRFPHIEHQPPPPLKTPISDTSTTFSTFRLSRDQINALKQNLKGNTSYEAVVGHVWRCVCVARQLPPDQETMLQFPVDGRHRLRPPLPPGYFGNVSFYTAAIALCGELESNPLSFAVGKVHEAIARMDDDYLRSAMDFSELRLQQRSSKSNDVVENRVKCPNLGITSWLGLPSYESDFGWGKPVYGGPGVATPEGKGFLFVDPQNERGLLLAITLHTQHMKRFQTLISKI